MLLPCVAPIAKVVNRGVMVVAENKTIRNATNFGKGLDLVTTFSVFEYVQHDYHSSIKIANYLVK